MKVSLYKLIQEITALVFEKEEMEFRDKSEQKPLLLLLAYQDSISEVVILF